MDYKVKLGSIVSDNNRTFYIESRFKFLIQHLNYIENKK